MFVSDGSKKLTEQLEIMFNGRKYLLMFIALSVLSVNVIILADVFSSENHGSWSVKKVCTVNQPQQYVLIYLSF